MKNRFQLLFYFILILLIFPGCKALNQRIANNYYEEYAYSKAIPKYEKVLAKSFSTEAASRLADSYRKTGNSLKAEYWYQRLAGSQTINLSDKKSYAEVLMENGKYDEAKNWFNEYLLLNNTDSKVKRMVRACDSIHLFFEDTTVYEITLLKLNKGVESNFSPIYYNDGIVFLSDRYVQGKPGGKSSWTGRGYLDLYYSEISDGDNWKQPVLLPGNINGNFDEGPAAIAPDSATIYFTRTDYSGNTIEKNQKNVSTLKMYKGNLIDDKWKLGELMAFNNKDFSVGHPTVSPDGNTLYFVSDMPWGYGGTDIYYVKSVDGKWNDPVNMGNEINTEGQEMFPFFANDSVLYFASDGHIGLGGLDIFASYYENGKWSKPENLQYPVNSSKDDFGFVINSDNSMGYFSSNRKLNLDMIYGFSKNPPEFNFIATTIDMESGEPLNKCRVFDMRSDGSSVLLGESSNGEIHISLSPKSDYDLHIKKNGYYAINKDVSTYGLRKSYDFIDTLVLKKIDLNKSEIWPDIKFIKKEDEINESTALVLDSLVGILNANPEISIDIIAHTDSRGSYRNNLNLSKKRAGNILDYLVNKGVERERLVSLGYGESRLLNNCRDYILCLEEDHEVNNRIEIKVTSIKNK